MTFSKGHLCFHIRHGGLMVPSGLRETYFFLLSKELGNLRHRDLANNIYHVIIMNVASLGQPPRAPGLALGWGLRPPSLAPPRGSCGRGGGLNVRLTGERKGVESKPYPKDKDHGSHSVAVCCIESPRKPLPKTDGSQSGPQARQQRWLPTQSPGIFSLLFSNLLFNGS